MNERIERLWWKARMGSVNNHQNPEVLAKFAELIVKECSKVIVNGGYRNPALGETHPLTPPEIAMMIKEHFGVEE